MGDTVLHSHAIKPGGCICQPLIGNNLTGKLVENTAIWEKEQPRNNLCVSPGLKFHWATDENELTDADVLEMQHHAHAGAAAAKKTAGKNGAELSVRGECFGRLRCLNWKKRGKFNPHLARMVHPWYKMIGCYG